MIVILEHEYQKDLPENEQKRYVVISDWNTYKDCLLGIKNCYPIISMPKRTLSCDLFRITSEDQNKHLTIEYRYKNLKPTFVHEATVVNKRSFYEELVVVCNGEENNDSETVDR